MSAVFCPWCGKPYSTHPEGQGCAVLESALTRSIAAASALVLAQRDEKADQITLSAAITPRVYALTNAAGSALLILGYNKNRGTALVYNDDAADIWLGEDKQHIEDATKRFPLKTKGAIVFTSPAEVWAFGNAAGPQSLFVMELPPGRQASELAILTKLA